MTTGIAHEDVRSGQAVPAQELAGVDRAEVLDVDTVRHDLNGGVGPHRLDEVVAGGLAWRDNGVGSAKEPALVARRQAGEGVFDPLAVCEVVRVLARRSVVVRDDRDVSPPPESERRDAECEGGVSVDDVDVGVADGAWHAGEAETKPVVVRKRKRPYRVFIKCRVVTAGVGVDDVHPTAAVDPAVAPRLHRVGDAVDRWQVSVGKGDDRLVTHRTLFVGGVANRL